MTIKARFAVAGTGFLAIAALAAYLVCVVEIPKEHFGVLENKTGRLLTNGEEVATSPAHQGIQLEVLSEGRHFINPYNSRVRVYPMVQIPGDKMGVRIRLYGDDLPYGDFLAKDTQHKGIIEDVLKPGRYAINAMVIDRETKKEIGEAKRSERKDYIELIELWDPKVIPAGYEGIVTHLAGPMAKDPNVLTVAAGERGTQEVTLKPGTYYRNPYIERINAIEIRSLRFNLSEGEDMTFPSKDGFPISIDGIVEFRVDPQVAPRTYVIYNEQSNDQPNAANIQAEIIEKVIKPNARSFCRLRGSNSSAREFIGGSTRDVFQKDFQKSLTEQCKAQGIIIEQALITRIKPPEAIAQPLRDRELALQKKKQYIQQGLQQIEAAKLATETSLIEQKKALVNAEKDVIEKVTAAQQAQDVALEVAGQEKEVAERKLAAAADEAIAIKSKAEAKAAVIGFENAALAAGWKAAVTAMGGNGDAYADFTMYKKLAPSFKRIMSNTADNSPLMKLFEGPREPKKAPSPKVEQSGK